VPHLHSAWSSLLVSAIYLGIADAARDWLVGFLPSRVPTNRGQPLATVERMRIALDETDALRMFATEQRADTVAANLTPHEPGWFLITLSARADAEGAPGRGGH